eukprot:g69869.t1
MLRGSKNTVLRNETGALLGTSPDFIMGHPTDTCPSCGGVLEHKDTILKCRRCHWTRERPIHTPPHKPASSNPDCLGGEMTDLAWIEIDKLQKAEGCASKFSPFLTEQFGDGSATFIPLVSGCINPIT